MNYLPLENVDNHFSGRNKAEKSIHMDKLNKRMMQPLISYPN